jgi:hypothetical protein
MRGAGGAHGLPYEANHRPRFVVKQARLDVARDQSGRLEPSQFWNHDKPECSNVE